MNDKIKIINAIENNKIKESLEWSISNLNEKPNINTIIYAPNASGKTILSNILSGIISHFHTKFVEYVDDDESPHIILLDKAKKFSYNDFNSYKKIINSNDNLKKLHNLINSHFIFKINEDLVKFEFLESINQNLINEAKSYINLYQHQFYFESSNWFALDWVNKIKNKDINHYSKLQGNSRYIRKLLKQRKYSGKLNFIYFLILLAHSCEEQILNLIELEMGIFMENDYNFVNTNRLNNTILNNISKGLKKVGIIDEEIDLKLRNEKIIFVSKWKKINKTREIFKKISGGQSNLISLIFFSEITMTKGNKIIFDDPFDSLDNQNSYEVLRMIKRWENKKNIIVLTHKASSFHMMNEYLNNNWNIHYLKNKICFSIKDLKEFNRKLIYIWENGKYGNGILLMFRYLENDNKINSLIYTDNLDKYFILKFLENYYLDKKKSIESKCEIYDHLLKNYDKLLEIKKYLRKKYSIDELKLIKNKIKSASLKTKDKIIQKYEKLYFVINDFSHKNIWGYNLLEILSFSEELDELHKLCKEVTI